MIRFTLKCSQGHSFDSWFASADAFDKLMSAGMISCETCGASDVEKSLMAPNVRPSRKSATPITAPQDDQEKAIAKIKQAVEKDSEYVGVEFASEARAMHDGTAPERSIYGEARAKDAIELLQDGIPVTPLPFTPSKKTN